jgi:hypothetical protein
MSSSGASGSLGSPLQKVAMGMVIVVAYAYFPAHPSPSWARYDALPDPLGWLLVLLGMVALVRFDGAFSTTRWLAVAAGLVSLPMWVPQLNHRLEPSGEWFSSLPQIAFCLLLAREIGMRAAAQTPRDAYVAKRFGLLVWGFALVAVLPVLTLGGHVTPLEGPTQLVSLLVNIAFVYYLFRVHRREWLGGPGPLEIHPVRRTDA